MAMQGSLRNEQIDAFTAGRYRVAAAVQERQGLALASDREMWDGHPEKVLTCGEQWAATQQEALLALCAGLMRAAERCDNSDQRGAMVEALSQPQWLGTRASEALSRQFAYADRAASGLLRFNHFHADRAHRSDPAEGCWMLTQISRWGWSPFPSNRLEILSQVYRPDLCEQAQSLAGFAALPLPRRRFALADGIPFDQDEPLVYLSSLPGRPTPPVQTLALPFPPASAAVDPAALAAASPSPHR